MERETLEYVIDHEQAHLQRRDHWWKPLGSLLLTIYWFNPLCWIAYILLCRDIEVACDEKVIRDYAVTAGYDDDFFAEHTLILPYVESGSGSYRYDIRDISAEGSTFCLNVTRVDKNEGGTCDMAGWFVIAEVLDSD